MSSYSSSQTTTFTITHAKYIASKVVTDLKRIQRLYNSPSDAMISQYESELIEYLKYGFLEEVTYGFQRNGSWIEPMVRYKARELGNSFFTDEDPGKIYPGADIAGAHFTSYLITSSKYDLQSSAEQEAFKKNLPFQRNVSPAPGINGYLSSDKSYAAGGLALDRSSLKSR